MKFTADVQVHPNGTCRPLSSFEAYHVSCANIGQPSTLAFLATLPHSLPNLAPKSIARAIDILLLQYPLLSCAIRSGRDRVPWFEMHGDVSAQFVLKGFVGRTDDDETLLEELVEMGDTFKAREGPLWRVVYYRGAQEQRVGLAIARVLSDAVGARNLFAELLKLLRAPLEAGELRASEPRALVAPYELTADALLKWRMKLNRKLDQVTSLLPRRKDAPPRAVPSPRLTTASNLASGRTQCALLTLTHSQILALELFGNTHKMNTFPHLIPGAIFAAALLANEDGAFTKGAVRLSRAVSRRDVAELEAKGNPIPRATGHYTRHFTTDLIVSSKQSFVEHCKAYMQTGPTTLLQMHSRERLSVLRTLPHPELGQTFAGQGGKKYPIHRTEKFLIDTALGETEQQIDIAIEGVGNMDTVGCEGEAGFKLSAAQSAGVASGTLAITILSDSTYATSISVCWQKGPREQNEYVGRFVAQLEVILERLARKGAVDGETTLEAFRR